MKCTICRVNNIGPGAKPFGGFLCMNEHLQCYKCNETNMGVCLQCSASTKFVQMKFDSLQLGSFEKQIPHEIDSQSRFTNEHLNMNCSADTIKQNIHYSLHEEASVENSASFINGSNGRNVEELSEAEPCQSSLSVIENNVTDNTTALRKVFDASDLRFIDSTESFKHFIDGSKDCKTLPSSCNKGEQLKYLSAKVLHDFDSHSPSFKNELLNNYLENSCSASFHASSMHNRKNSSWPSDVEPRSPKLELKMKSISISTESDPSLKSICSQMPEQNIGGKCNPQDYFVMQAAAVTPTDQVVNFIANKTRDVPIMDMRMQKIFETLKEDIRMNGFSEKSDLTKTPTQMSAKEQEGKRAVTNNCSKEDKSSDLMDPMYNTYRPHYNTPLANVLTATNLFAPPTNHSEQQEPPMPQFNRVPCSNVTAPALFLKQIDVSQIKTVPAKLLRIPRSPILCPESTCQRMIFVSDFSKHLAVDHTHLPIERINPFQCKHFFLDARLFKNGASKSHLLFLMCDKIIDLGSTEYKDFLPILVMTSRISLHQICSLQPRKESLTDYFLIWVTGITPEELPISVSLTVWSSQAAKAPACHIVYSGQMYSIRNSQSALDVWQTGRALLLSPQEMAALTTNGSEMLNVQLSVH